MKKEILAMQCKKIKKLKDKIKTLKREKENLNQALIGALNKIDSLINFTEKEK